MTDSLSTTAHLPAVTEAAFLYPIFENIHAALKTQPWAVWIAEPRPDRSGKFNKAPRSPTTGRNIGTTKPHLFGTFDDACKAFETGKYTGVGVLLTGNGIIGVDIDDYIDTFKANEQVKAWVNQACGAGAYCEHSPSGNGLRLFMAGKLPTTGRKSGPLEIYDDVRFLTVTGHVVDYAKGGA